MISITKAIVLLSVITGIWAHTDSYHTCVHDQIDFKPEFIDVPIADGPQEGRSLQDEYQNIRIVFDYDGGAFNSTPADFQNYIKNTILPPVKNIFQAALKVKPVVGNLTGQKLTTMCSNSIVVPAIYNNGGVPADLVLFVDIVNDTSQSYVAFAGPCVQSTQNKRPIFGRIVYNMAKVRANTNSATIEKDTSVTLHETTHALGLTSGLYTYFIDPTTNKALTGHIMTKTVNGVPVQVLNLNPLTARLREYFNCSTLEGAYMENEGSSGSKNSHFERRIFYNEYMTASTLQDVRISQFTLAFLEGTGWYKADFSMAEPTTWGKGKGCAFLDTPCVNNVTKTPNFEEFCSPLKKMMCSYTNRGAGVCGTSSMKVNSALNSAVNYWGNNTIMNDGFADNCPIPDIYSNLDCEDERNQAGSTLPSQEFYGVGGKCFIATLYPFGTSSPFGYCFKQSCELQSDGNYLLKVMVGNNTVVCNNTDQLSVPGLGGKLFCPDPNDFCTKLNSEGFCRKSCSARGTCVDKQCQCNEGWGNYDCTRQIYKDNCAACANQDPFRTTCYGDSCVCNPSNKTCMCQLGMMTGSDCNGIQTVSSPQSTTTANTTTNNTTNTSSTTTSTPSTNTTSNTTTTNTTSTSPTTTTSGTSTPTNTTSNTTTNTTSTSPTTISSTSTNTTNTNTTKTNTTNTTTNTTNTTTTSPTTTNSTSTNTTSNTTKTNTTTASPTTTTSSPTSTNTTSNTTTNATSTSPTTTSNTSTNTTSTNTTTTKTNTTSTTTTNSTSTNTTSNATSTNTTSTNTTSTNTTTTKTNTTTNTTTTTSPTTTSNTTSTNTTSNTTTTSSNTTTASTQNSTTSTSSSTTNTSTTNTTTKTPSFKSLTGSKTNYDSDGGSGETRNVQTESTTGNKVETISSGTNLGLILGLVGGGLVILSLGIYFGWKYGRNYIKNRATRKPSLKKSNSIANPALRRQMTSNQNKYAYVP